MPSNINPRSGPFPIYASASPPTIDIGIFTIVKTGVNFQTNNTTDIFTVPAGRAFVCDYARLIPTSISSGAAIAIVWKIIESGASAVMTIAGTAANTSPSLVKVWCSAGTTLPASNGPFTICAAGNKVQFNGTTMWTTSTTVTGSVFVTGFYCS